MAQRNGSLAKPTVHRAVPGCVALRYLVRQGMPPFSSPDPVAQAMEHLAWQATAEVRRSAVAFGRAIGLVTASGTALTLWLVLVHAPMGTDIAFRMAAGVALLTTSLDATEAARRWWWCRGLHLSIAAGHIHVAMHRVLNQPASHDV